MNADYDAVVVGGGLAGLTSAAYLCRYGYRTLLCEKSSHTGGLVTTFQHHGFVFDAGIRAFENSGILFPMLEDLGIELEFVGNPVSIGIEDRWVKLDSRASLRGYAEMLTGLFPREAADIAAIAQEIEKVMGYMDVLYGIDNPLFMEGRMDRAYLTGTLLPWLLRYQVNIRKAGRLDRPVADYLRGFTGNQALIDMVAQHFFKDTPTFFALSYFGLYLDYLYPKGGTGVLAQAVTDSIRLAGGKVLTGTRVGCVQVDRHQVLSEDGGVYGYRKLIWASDQKTLYATTDTVHTSRIERQRRLVDAGRGGDSVLSVFLCVGLEGAFFEDRCGPHAFYTPSKQGLSSLGAWDEVGDDEELWGWIDRYLELTTYEISCPSLRDASLAPEGKTGVIVSALMDYRLVSHLADAGLYERFKKRCIGKVVEVLEAAVFPGISGKVESTLCSTPLTIERETGNAQGAITGWAFTEGVMPAENRFRKIAGSIKTPLEDVYHCGQWSFSPSGLPVSILTGKLSADAVRRKLGKVGS